MLGNVTRVPKVCFATAKYPAKWSFGCEIGIFHVLGFRSRFAAAKWGSLCCKMALVWQNVLRSREIPYGMELWLRNWKFSRFRASQPFRSCEMRVTVLRNGTRVPKWVSQLRKFSQRLLQCCGMVWQQNVDFAEAAKSRRPLFFPCFRSVWLRFCSDFFFFNFFAIPLDFDHPKTYITSKQTRDRKSVV